MKIRFLCLGVVFAVFALVFVSFHTNSENLRGRTFAAKFADTKLSAAETTGNYDIDAKHSHIGFRVTHLGLVEVPGAFRDFSGTINYDGKDVTKSSVNFTAKVTSVDTGVASRDNHLRNADFFEVEKYPEMTFKSTKIEKKGDNWKVTGDFTLKGVTKQITIPFKINGIKNERGNIAMGISAQTSINRQDYGVKYGNKLDDGTLDISDMVKIELQLEAWRQKKSATETGSDSAALGEKGFVPAADASIDTMTKLPTRIVHRTVSLVTETQKPKKTIKEQ